MVSTILRLGFCVVAALAVLGVASGRGRTITRVQLTHIACLMLAFSTLHSNHTSPPTMLFPVIAVVAGFLAVWHVVRKIECEMSPSVELLLVVCELMMAASASALSGQGASVADLRAGSAAMALVVAMLVALRLKHELAGFLSWHHGAPLIAFSLTCCLVLAWQLRNGSFPHVATVAASNACSMAFMFFVLSFVANHVYERESDTDEDAGEIVYEDEDEDGYADPYVPSSHLPLLYGTTLFPIACGIFVGNMALGLGVAAAAFAALWPKGSGKRWHLATLLYVFGCTVFLASNFYPTLLQQAHWMPGVDSESFLAMLAREPLGLGASFAFLNDSPESMHAVLRLVIKALGIPGLLLLALCFVASVVLGARVIVDKSARGRASSFLLVVWGMYGLCTLGGVAGVIPCYTFYEAPFLCLSYSGIPFFDIALVALTLAYECAAEDCDELLLAR